MFPAMDEHATRACARYASGDDSQYEKRLGMICETEQFPFRVTRAELVRKFHERWREREGEEETGSVADSTMGIVWWMGVPSRVRWKKARTP